MTQEPDLDPGRLLSGCTALWLNPKVYPLIVVALRAVSGGREVITSGL